MENFRISTKDVVLSAVAFGIGMASYYAGGYFGAMLCAFISGMFLTTALFKPLVEQMQQTLEDHVNFLKKFEDHLHKKD